MSRLLLDTCAGLWLMSGERMRREALDAIVESAREDDLWISPFSAWEVALLLSKGRLALEIAAEAWFERLAAMPGVRVAELDAPTLADSVNLPGKPHNDPADRILIASARRLGAPLVTRDKDIEAYARAGHVRVLRC